MFKAIWKLVVIGIIIVTVISGVHDDKEEKIYDCVADYCVSKDIQFVEMADEGNEDMVSFYTYENHELVYNEITVDELERITGEEVN